MNACLSSPVKRCIVLSPHLDDAALSIGGFIYTWAKTHHVEVWTLFCGAPWCGPYSPLARWFHNVSGGMRGQSLFGLRMQEDVCAMAALGVKNWRHFQWLDAIYRRRDIFRFTYTDCRQSRWDNSDEPLIDRILSLVKSGLSAGDLLICPLGIGGHVDHLITREIAHQITDYPKVWYPEVPYVQRFPLELEPATSGLSQVLQALPQPAVQAWADAVRCYTSQLAMLDQVCGNTVAFIEALAKDPYPLWTNQPEILSASELLS